MGRKDYEISILRLSSDILSKIHRISRRHKIPLKTIWEDLDVMLSTSNAREEVKIEKKNQHEKQ